MYIFSTKDQLKLLQGFDSIVGVSDDLKRFHGKIREALVKMTLNTASISDQDLYDLMVYYNDNDILNENEHLLAMLRGYVDQRFPYMERSVILNYCTLLKDLGMFFEDKDLIVQLEEYFLDNYTEFSLEELFSLQKLTSYCFYQPPKLLQML